MPNLTPDFIARQFRLIDNGMRNLAQRVDEAKALSSSIVILAKAIKSSQAPDDSIQGRVNSLLRNAQHIVPMIYNIEITIPATTARQSATQNLTQGGYFILDEIRAAWRPTAGANAGTWQAGSSGHPEIVNAAEIGGAAVTDVLDFSWELVEGVAQRARQNVNPTPGHYLYGRDRGMVLHAPDLYMPASAVTVFITPHSAPDNAGILVFSLCGRQMLTLAADIGLDEVVPA
jgi:hypothetical protein